jgi:signal transduction histidine kinase
VGTPPVAVLLAGSRGSREWSRRDTERLAGIAAFVEGALAAAGARRNAEEAAILRERRRVAKELHDTVGQLLFGAGVAARMARESAGTGRPDGAERLLATEREIARATAALRHALRALDGPRGTQGALPTSMSEAVEAFRHRTGVPAQLIVLGERRGLGLDEERLLVMVVAEALNNVERHSGAAEVVVTLSFEDERVAVVVQDDGVGLAGIEGRGTGLGIDLLREECGLRGGGLTLGANDDGGATLRAWIAVGS